MQIQVYTNTGGRFSLQVEKCWTFTQIQKEIEDQSGLAVAQQVLLFGGRQLKLMATFEAAGIKDGDTITVLPLSLFKSHTKRNG
jgi:hypothetical protein